MVGFVGVGWRGVYQQVRMLFWWEDVFHRLWEIYCPSVAHEECQRLKPHKYVW